MRLLVLFLLLTPVMADRSLLLKESRAWEGELIVELQADGEVQREVATFMLLTDPARTSGSRSRLKMRQRSASAEWSLRIDRRRSQGSRDLITKGGGAGVLRVAVHGRLDVSTGNVQLNISTKRSRLVVKTMLSGEDSRGFAAYQTVASRPPLLAALSESGQLSSDGLTVVGERIVESRRSARRHKLTIRWTLRRMDPEVRGRILDQHGAPVAGVEVIAQTLGREGMLLRTGKSGADGRFSILADFGPWGVRIKGRHEKGIVTGGWSRVDAVNLKLDKRSHLDVRVERYQLSKLPKSALLQSHFRGDVDAYMAYLVRRVSAARLRSARATNSAPSPVEAAAPAR